MHVSIEAEYWVIDRSGALADPGGLTDLSEHVVPEFVEPLLEIKTSPCESVRALYDEFVARLKWVLEEANARDRMLVPTGTPIGPAEVTEQEGERGAIQRAVVGEDFEYAAHCAGTHVHFDREDVTDQLNTLIAFDPALALLSSSPYYGGRRVAACARAFIYRKRSYETFPRHGQLWEYVDSVEQWNQLLEHRFREFEAAAMEEGIDPELFGEHFSPEDTVWTPLRLRTEVPTVEWRSPDVALPSETLRLVREMAAVMERVPETDVVIGDEEGRVGEELISLPGFGTLRDLTDEAITTGLESPEVRAYLDRMGFDVSAYRPLTHRIDGERQMGERQARDLRLDLARCLEADVERLQRSSLDRIVGEGAS
ncbi:glutamate-cysteine ligase family protein [Natronorarus salvus]|uniref:glutamate-cysteine ligase family protein n=1 Tax=Natronorarus salvus TaxID=3117733 RepID=UPI002F261B5E